MLSFRPLFILYEVNSNLLKFAVFNVKLEANPYVSPFTHFKALTTDLNNIKGVIIDTKGTTPAIANITGKIIYIYSTYALDVKVIVLYI